jgi:hypothetical protein
VTRIFAARPVKPRRFFSWRRRCRTRGFAAPEDYSVAVCILPGTELAFEKPVKYQTTLMFRANTGHTVAIFRQINEGALHVNHDAMARSCC